MHGVVDGGNSDDSDDSHGDCHKALNLAQNCQVAVDSDVAKRQNVSAALKLAKQTKTTRIEDIDSGM